MKKIIITFTTIFCIGNLIFAQNFYAGLKTGFKLETYKIPLEKNATNSNYHFQDRPILTQSMDFSAPTLQMVFRITFFNNLEIETGVGWYNYSQKLKARITPNCAYSTFGVRDANETTDTYVFSTAKESVYGCIFLSPKAGYRVKLSQNLHFRINTGLQVGFLYNARQTSNSMVESDPFELYVVYHGVKKPYINLLVSNTISLQYITKPNFYFSIFASYHAGLINVYQSDVYLANRRSNENDFYNGHDSYLNSAITTKGSYFEFGIELGYMWDKKGGNKDL